VVAQGVKSEGADCYCNQGGGRGVAEARINVEDPNPGSMRRGIRCRWSIHPRRRGLLART